MIPVQEVWAEWFDGEVECIDSAESESEAVYLANEYRMAYQGTAARIWIQLARDS